MVKIKPLRLICSDKGREVTISGFLGGGVGALGNSTGPLLEILNLYLALGKKTLRNDKTHMQCQIYLKAN